MEEPRPVEGPIRVVGRYALYGKLASGGMATVHFGRLLGPAGFSRTVAIKRLHPQFAKDPEFVAMFLDEARLAARIQHPNVVATVDVVARSEELFLVMDYIRGESFSRLLRASRRRGIDVSLAVVGSVIVGMLHGLHAAHEANDEQGRPLSVVHRDVSPQNVLVGIDGVTRVLDFGVAKAAARVQVTRDGQMKGKLSYMSPEQLQGRGVDRRTDVFAAGIVLWEALTGRRLFDAEEPQEVLRMIVNDEAPPPSAIVPSIPREVDAVVMKALSRNVATRFQTARQFAIAVEEVVRLASAREVGEWVETVAGETLLHREQAVAEIEAISTVSEVSVTTETARGAMMALTPAEPTLREPRGARGLLGDRSRSGDWDAGATLLYGSPAPVTPDAAATRVHVPRPGAGASFDEAQTTVRATEPPKRSPDDEETVILEDLAARVTRPPLASRPSMTSVVTSDHTDPTGYREFLPGWMAVADWFWARPERRTVRVATGAGVAALFLGFAAAGIGGQRHREGPPARQRQAIATAVASPAPIETTAHSTISMGSTRSTERAGSDPETSSPPGTSPSAKDEPSNQNGRAHVEPPPVPVGSVLSLDDPEPSPALDNPYETNPRPNRPARHVVPPPSATGSSYVIKTGCAQPFIVDERGIRRVKPECL